MDHLPSPRSGVSMMGSYIALMDFPHLISFHLVPASAHVRRSKKEAPTGRSLHQPNGYKNSRGILPTLLQGGKYSCPCLDKPRLSVYLRVNEPWKLFQRKRSSRPRRVGPLTINIAFNTAAGGVISPSTPTTRGIPVGSGFTAG